MHLTLPLDSHGGNTAGFVIAPEIVDALGGGRRPKVVVTIHDHTWRSSIASMGGRFLLGVSMENRRLAGVAAGEVVDLDLRLDVAPREVALPADLAGALAAVPGARGAFDRLAFTQRKEHVRAVEEARRPETRTRRIASVVRAVSP